MLISTILTMKLVVLRLNYGRKISRIEGMIMNSALGVWDWVIILDIVGHLVDMCYIIFKSQSS